jgi:8-oxo-dGTP pyrophosphatase MutT (NUDIX family)
MNTNDENVEVVDNDGNKLSVCSKKETHEKGLLHVTVVSEVINTKGEWLLVRQSGDRQDAGQLVSPVGGHVIAGETTEEALKREAFEELGISGFIYKYIGRAIFNREIIGRKENHLFFLYEIYSDANPKLNHESVGFEFFSKAKLAQRMKINPQEFGEAWWFVVNNFYNEFIS